MARTVLVRFFQLSLLLLTIGFGMQAAGVKHKVVLVSLEKTEWRLVWLKGTKIETATPQQMPYIQLESGRMSGSGGCNRLTGGYELNGNNLKFSQMALTRMACLHGGNTESQFVQALEDVSAWKIASGLLWLMDADGHVLAKFSAYIPEDAQHPEPQSTH